MFGSSSPNDSTSYYFGCNTYALTGTDDVMFIICPVNGVVSAATVHTYAATAAGTGENIVVSLRKNATTDYAIETVGAAAAVRNFENYLMNAPVTIGDHLAIKMATPAWVTNPTGLYGNGVIIIDVF
jgi:hypothetical protein